MKTTVSEKGQITIPKPLRLRLGIKPRQVLNVREDRGCLVLAKTDVSDPVESVFGILDLGGSTDALMVSLRGEGHDRKRQTGARGGRKSSLSRSVKKTQE